MSADGYLPPGVTQAEIDAYHQGDEPPEEAVACDHCGGEGICGRSITVYDHGCAWPRPDAEEWPCPACGGAGFHVEEKRDDRAMNDPPWRHFTDEEAEAWEAIFRSDATTNHPVTTHDKAEPQ